MDEQTLRDLLEHATADRPEATVDLDGAVRDGARRRRTRRLGTAAGLVAGGLVVGAVMVGGTLLAAPDTAGPADVTPVPSVPAEQDCGTYRQPDPVTLPVTPAGRACFVDALAAHRPARLVVSMLTDEGDPVTTTYEALTTGRARVTTDSSQDRFSGGVSVSVQLCSGIDPRSLGSGAEPGTAPSGHILFLECSDASPATVPST